MLYWFGKIFVAPFFWLLFWPKVLHKERLASQGAVIYYCNHFSLADAVAIAAVSPRVIHFMGKEELFSTPIGRFFFTNLLMIPAGEGGGSRLGPVKKSLAMLEKGMAFGIFPEGHRSAVYTELDSLEKGVAFIAMKANVPVIPIYIDPLSWVRKKVRMTVGEWIHPQKVKEECPGQKPVEALLDRLEDELITLRREVEDMVPLRLRRKI